MTIESVCFKGVTKRFKMYNNNKEKLLDIFVPKGYGEDFYGVQNINFSAYQGDVIGVIGINGAGKSTLSNLITGVVPPTSGSIEIIGSASLIAIASGLNNQLTGRENIELKCLMLGFNKNEIKQLIPEIIEFADIGKFIDQPVKSYSSGTKSRLGFAISVNINPDILVIDEALSVGDQTFTDKCLDKMNEFKQNGKTIFFISHSISQVKKFCDKALWLEAGEIRDYGSIKEIIPKYEKFLKDFKALSKEEQKQFRQNILDRRSQLNTSPVKFGEDSASETKDIIRSRKRGKKSRKGWAYIISSLLLGALLIIGTFYLMDIFKGNEKTSNINKAASDKVSNQDVMVGETIEEKELTDLRYVTVSSANIRQEPTIESEALDFAIFGIPYEVIEEKDGWAKIKPDGSEEGWVSTSILTALTRDNNDSEIEQKLEELINFTHPLADIIQFIGGNQGEEELISNTEYTYEDQIIKGFILTINGPASEELFEHLGTPDVELEATRTYLYHGNELDYLFQQIDDGTIGSIQVSKRKI